MNRIHAVAGTLALACIATFWISSLVSEVFLPLEAVVAVKRFVVHGLWVLVPALAMTGASGFSLARSRQGSLVERKLARMRVIAANGLLVLVPCALFLRYKAEVGAFDPAFIAVQALELAAGLANLWLMGLNARDGLRLSGRLAQAASPSRDR